MKKPRLTFLSFMLPSIAVCVGLACFGVAQEGQQQPSIIVGGDAAPPAKDPAPATPAAASGELCEVPLAELLLAKRTAGIEAIKKVMQAEIEAAIAEHKRQEKELEDWLSKEREKLADGSKPAASVANRK